MGNWIIKAAVQKAISLLPFSNRINFFFQKNVTKGIILTETLFLQKLQHAREHIQHYKKFSVSTHTGTALELGTGWYPIVPVSLFLCGFNKIITIDQSSLLAEENVKEVLNYFLKYHEQRRLLELLPYYHEDRIVRLKKLSGASLEEILKGLHIEVIVGDARNTSEANDSIDYFVSNNTLEHIPKPVIVDIFKEFRRIAGRNSIMSHFIDLTDHFAHFDKGISTFNFLRFSPSEWSIINNSVQYLNRLRIDDFLKIHDETGFEIIGKEYLYADEKQLSGLKVHKDFEHLSRKELLVSHCWFISK
jgi:hypothetical protein